MELISWSLNAIDKIFSTRRAGSGEPACPDGTFAAGYVMDSWDSWRMVCLAVLSLEDVEDVYLFGFMVAGLLILAVGIALVYREIREIKKMAALQGAPKLSGMINEVGKAVISQTVMINDLCRRVDNNLGKLTELQGKLIEMTRD